MQRAIERPCPFDEKSKRPALCILEEARTGIGGHPGAKACLQTGFPNRSKIDSRLEMEISLDSIDVERGPMGPDRAGAVGQSQ